MERDPPEWKGIQPPTFFVHPGYPTNKCLHDSWDESGHGGPTGNSEEFEFDEEVDLASPFLRGMLSDKQLVPNFEDTTFEITTGNTGTETRNREPSEDDWENM